VRQGTKQAETDEPQGAPEWMVTFSDCMTLLLTFFVLLLSFSSFDESLILKLKLVFGEASPSVSLQKEQTGDAFLPTKQIQSTEEPDEGSEKPTLKRGSQDNLREDAEPMDIYSRKVFLIPSDKVFWGKGTVISAEGRNLITTIASLLKELPNRIVISENAREVNKPTENLGLSRAWAVMGYLTRQQGIDRKRFSISAVSTIEEEKTSNAKQDLSERKAERMLEIVLLEGSIYN
jgi:chemotaxis protein MotB